MARYSIEIESEGMMLPLLISIEASMMFHSRLEIIEELTLVIMDTFK